MATVNTGLFGQALWPGVEAWYGKAYNEFKVEYDFIYSKKKSTKAYEMVQSIAPVGLLVQKPEGDPIAYDIEQQGFNDKYVHATWALGIMITKEMVEDDQYDVTGQFKSAGLAFSARQTKEINAASLLNLAFAGSGKLYGDGKTLIATDHPNVRGGSWSNRMAVDTDLSEAALEQAVIDIGQYSDDAGRKIAVMGEKIVVPVQLDFVANKIMKTEYEVNSNNNTVNVVRSRFTGGVGINHYLTDADAWFILTNVPNGMTYYERIADTLAQDDDFDTDNAKFRVRGRYSFGCGDKKHIYGTPGA